MRREKVSGNQVKGHEFSDDYSSQLEDDQPLTRLLIPQVWREKACWVFCSFPPHHARVGASTQRWGVSGGGGVGGIEARIFRLKLWFPSHQHVTL